MPKRAGASRAKGTGPKAKKRGPIVSPDSPVASPPPTRKLFVPQKPVQGASLPTPEDRSETRRVARTHSNGVSSGPAPAKRKIFVPEKPKPVPFRDVMQPKGDFLIPPRAICEQCGAVAGQQFHQSDCLYRDWPLLIEGAEYRPTFVWSLNAPSDACIDCGALGIQGWSGASHFLHPGQETPVMVEHDRQLHLWWCPWWHAHPGVTPFDTPKVKGPGPEDVGLLEEDDDDEPF